mmetsp:Transcript_6456/g.8898  ORF Transcript_6456/g.8898 Transcript_6456/m.8898 type:complete len:246 (-) Transcript_6456:289-1026(-)
MKHIKLVYEDEVEQRDIRRFQLADMAKEKFELCLGMAKSLFRLKECYLQYLDEDLEKIVIGSELELDEAIALHTRLGKRSIKLFVSKGTPELCQSWTTVTISESLLQSTEEKSTREEKELETKEGNISSHPSCKGVTKRNEISDNSTTRRESKLKSFNGVDLDVLTHGLLNHKGFTSELPLLAVAIQNGGNLGDVAAALIKKFPDLLEIPGMREISPQLESLQLFIESQWAQLAMLVKSMTRTLA